MSSAPHENVRLLVSQAVLNLLDGLISRKIRAEGYNARLAVLKKFIESHRGSPESIIMLMPQEVRVGGEERFRVDMVLGGKIAFDFKSTKSEFDAAVDAARAKYLPHLPGVSYYVITNWNSWRFYRVIRRGDNIDLRLVVEGEKDAAIAELERVLAEEIEELKVPPHPDAIATLYSIDIDKLRKDMMDVLNSVLNDRDVAPLFEAYKKVMETLYPGGGEDFVKELYVNHTLMHMMVMASLSAVLNRIGRKIDRSSDIDICSGRALPPGLDVALPYLNWWRIGFEKMSKEHQEVIRRIVGDIVVKAYLVDWDLDSSEDVFRVLYELLVEPHVRRSIGEYYTPIWLVDRILSEFTLKDKLVMDPFCGSGTFLVRAFHKKIMEGEDIDSAYEEVVGFDINPLAVAVARAELVISYVRATSREPKKSLRLPSTPPRVYHADTLAAWFGGGSLALSDPNYSRIVESLEAHISAKVKLEIANKLANIKPKDALSVVSSFEHLLAVGIPLYMHEEDFENKLADHILNGLREDNPIESVLREVVSESNFMSNLAALVKRYGDGVWAAVLSSSASLALLSAIRPHVIVTNPPWVHITEYKTGYTKKMHETLREVLMSSLKAPPKRASSIATGSDVAIAALYKALEIAREGVGFVMSRKQAFDSRAPVNAGIVTTYAVLESKCADCLVKLIDVDYDAFGHGVRPALAIALKGKGKGEMKAELYVLEVEDGSILKAFDITKVKAKEAKLDMSYKDYVRPAIPWATLDAKGLARALDVVKVIIAGGYIMGLFGGEKKSGNERYAGLVVSDLKPAHGGLYVRLFNTDKGYLVPSELMRKHGVDIYKVYYRGRINPFKCSALNVILSSFGEGELKKFIYEVIQINKNTMTEGDERRLRRLAEEVKAQINVLRGSHYVVYRGNRVFTACVPEDLSKSVSEIRTAYIECKSAEQAHFYAAILNYIVYKAVSKRREFIRDQYAKPLLAIVAATLTWKDLPPQLRSEIARLSHALSKRLTWRKYPNQRRAILETARTPEFAKIIELLDKHIESAGKQSRLEGALGLVSGTSTEPQAGRR